QNASALSVPDIRWDRFQAMIRQSVSLPAGNPIERLRQSPGITAPTWERLSGESELTDEQKSQVVQELNQVLLDKKFYDAKSFSEVSLSPETRKALTTAGARQKQADLQHMNRGLLDDVFGEAVTPQAWYTPLRKLAV
ncbi:MAG: hypothetical protein ACK53L_15665, partial [Pirellulaceae bacterium]